MSLDLFGIKDKCSIENCDVLVLILIVFGIVLFLGVSLVIRRKIRAKRAKVQRKSQKKSSKILKTLPEIQTSERIEKKPQKNSRFFKTKVQKERKISKVSIVNLNNTCEKFKTSSANNTNEKNNTETIKLEVKYFEEYDKNKDHEKKTQVNENDIGLINKNLYCLRLKHKNQMYPDDPSIQFEDVSDFAFESKKNSTGNFNLKGINVLSQENCHEKTEKIVKVVIFQKNEEYSRTNDQTSLNFNKDFDFRLREEQGRQRNSLKLIKFDETP